MVETEVKIIDIDVENIRKKLATLGAELVSSQIFSSLRYQIPKNDNNVCLIRLRKEGEDSRFSIKIDVGENSEIVKNREEFEVTVSDFATMETILEKLHYLVEDRRTFSRETYHYQELQIVIDTHKDNYSFIPPYLEIEGKSVTEIYRVADALGFKKDQCMGWSFKKLVEHYAGLQTT